MQCFSPELRDPQIIRTSFCDPSRFPPFDYDDFSCFDRGKKRKKTPNQKKLYIYKKPSKKLSKTYFLRITTFFCEGQDYGNWGALIFY